MEATDGRRVAYAPYQEAAAQFPQIPVENFKRAVHLVLPDGEVLSAAHAVFRSLALLPKYGWMLWAYHHVPGLRRNCRMDLPPGCRAPLVFLSCHRLSLGQASRAGHL